MKEPRDTTIGVTTMNADGGRTLRMWVVPRSFAEKFIKRLGDPDAEAVATADSVAASQELPGIAIVNHLADTA